MVIGLPKLMSWNTIFVILAALRDSVNATGLLCCQPAHHGYMIRLMGVLLCSDSDDEPDMEIDPRHLVTFSKVLLARSNELIRGGL
jgi:hypothetical protein